MRQEEPSATACCSIKRQYRAAKLTNRGDKVLESDTFLGAEDEDDDDDDDATAAAALPVVVVVPAAVLEVLADSLTFFVMTSALSLSASFASAAIVASSSLSCKSTVASVDVDVDVVVNARGRLVPLRAPCARARRERRSQILGSAASAAACEGSETPAT